MTRRRYSTPEESFLARTEPLPWSGCLLWTGGRTSAGYGALSLGGGKKVLAHRYAWEREHGPIPEGMVIDHRYHCDKACVEPGHLRLATRAKNNQNRRGAHCTSVTGVRGVSPATNGGYLAQVGRKGEFARKVFHDLEEAADWVAQKRIEIFGEYAGGN